MKLLFWIRKNLIPSIIIASLLGFLVGNLMDVSGLKNIIMPLTIMMVYPMMTGMNYSALRESSNRKLQLSVQVINFIVFPLIGYGIGLLFFKDEVYLRLGLLLITLLPTSGMTVSWTMMAKGNVQEAIRMVVIGLFLGAILAPFYINVLLGASINIPILTVTKSIGYVIFIPLILGYITQRTLKAKLGDEGFKNRVKPILPTISTLAISLMIFTAMSLRAKVLWNNPYLLIEMVIPVILLYASMYIVSVLVSKWLFSRNEAISFVNGTLVRNLSIGLAILFSAFEDAAIAAVLIAISYVIQVQFAAWNTRLSERIFGLEAKR